MYNLHFAVVLLAATMTAVLAASSFAAWMIAKIESLSSKDRRESQEAYRVGTGCTILAAGLTVIVFFTSF